MSDYHSRKAARIVQAQRLHGVKMITCTGCNGSGHYDNTGSPPCWSCAGPGKVRDRLNVLPSDPVPEPYGWRDKLKRTEHIRKVRRLV